MARTMSATRRLRTMPRGVSLLEVLVVIGVLVLLLAILVPSLYAAREKARRMFCQNNLRQWGVALQLYRQEHNEYLPTEGTYFDIGRHGTWFNELPRYVDLPAYKNVARDGELIREHPKIHLWICPSKNLTDAYKSGSGKNQFHYGMNQVLDGLGDPPDGSDDAPGFPDRGRKPVSALTYESEPRTVFLFDIAPNSPAGTPRSVATEYQRGYDGRKLGRFHGDYANVLFLDGAVGNCETDDLVTDRDFQDGEVIWTNRDLYWGFPRP